MLNEVMSYGESIESWGVKIREAKHPMLKPIPAKKKNVLVEFLDDGSYEIKDNVQVGFYYVKSNHFTGLTFKFKAADTLKKLQTRLDNQKSMAEIFSPNDELPLLNKLAIVIEGLDSEQFRQDLLSYIEDFAGDVYLSFDVEHDDYGLQSVDFIESFDAVLKLPSDDVELDAFGNPSGGCDKPMQPISVGRDRLKFFSKNPDNKCYERFGLSGAESCPVGDATRQRIVNIVQTALSANREATKGKSGLWYKYHVKKSQKKFDTYFVLTSLFPDIDVIQTVPERMKEKEWKYLVQGVIQSLQVPGKSAPRDSVGVVLILKKPSQASQPVQLCYSNIIDCDKLSQCVSDWKDGVLSFSGGHVPTISSLVYHMNRHYNRSDANDNDPAKSSEAKGKDKTKSSKVKDKAKSKGKDKAKSSGSSPQYFDLQDGYDFFFNKPETINKFLRFYASKIVPVTLYWAGKKNKPYARKILFPIRNLIAHKLGFKEDVMDDNWAFVLGRLFQRADWLYEQFFTTRGSKIPDNLVGSRFIQMAYVDPSMAYGQFCHAFRPCLNYCQNNSKVKGVVGYKALLTKLGELKEGGLPSSMSDKDKLCLDIGYNYYKPLVPKDGEGKNDESSK